MRPVRTTLPGSPAYHGMLRAIGLGTWVFLGLPILDSATRRGYTLTEAQWAAWLICFWCFGPAFWYSSNPQRRSPWARVAALSIETAAALGMTFLLQDYFVGFLLVIVSWQAALLLAPAVAVAWTLSASALLVLFLEPHYYMGWRWGATSAFVGFQVFALVTAALAQRESESRDDLARINAELVSTRELLRESSKLGERIRIARDLHDSVGHHLTALCLHLEAALNGPAERAPATTADLARAQETAKHVLQEVRSAVSVLRNGEDIDLRAALRALESRLPRVRLSLTVPDELRITDPARANAVLRCVQEVATNTLKHSDATNLWITLRLDRGGIEIEARDDGRSVRRAGSGFGLTAMRERFEELGGVVSFERGSDRGFEVRAWLPTRDSAAAGLPGETA